eukprot:2751507-Rhodomonas_salina.2
MMKLSGMAETDWTSAGAAAFIEARTALCSARPLGGGGRTKGGSRRQEGWQRHRRQPRRGIRRRVETNFDLLSGPNMNSSGVRE